MRVDWKGPGHSGPITAVEAHVAELVRQLGPLGALDKLDEARAVSITLAAEARARGQHHTAAGLDAAAARLWRCAVHLGAVG